MSAKAICLRCTRCWNIELDLRNVKTTTGMDVLRCQTPQMNEKQLWAQWISRGLTTATEDLQLFALIAQCKVGHRHGHAEKPK